MTKYSLTLDTLVMSFAIKTDLSLEEAKKEHKSWLAKIKRSKWIVIPTKLPVHMHTSAVICLRVVEITPQHEAMRRAEDNPAMERVLGGARTMNENLDGGYR